MKDIAAKALITKVVTDQFALIGVRDGIETQLVAQVEKSGGLADLLNQYNHYTGDPGYLSKEFALYQQVDGIGIHKV